VAARGCIWRAALVREAEHFSLTSERCRRNLTLEFSFVGNGALLDCIALQGMPRLAGFAGARSVESRPILVCSSTMSTN